MEPARMRRAATSALIFWLASACTRAERGPAPREPEAAPGPGPEAPAGAPEEAPAPPLERVGGEGPPAGFEPTGTPLVSEPWLQPRAAWRDLAARLSLLRADARRAGSPLLVRFEADVVHITGRDGVRRSLRLPPGLRLADVPVHLLLQADLGLRAWGADGTEIPLEEEVTVVRGVASVADADVEDFRLLVKGGRSFRSIP